tara:strand:+ start:203 stop:607 length:405 start_codon:yes stop_codon:yes gene_type:complete
LADIPNIFPDHFETIETIDIFISTQLCHQTIATEQNRPNGLCCQSKSTTALSVAAGAGGDHDEREKDVVTTSPGNRTKTTIDQILPFHKAEELIFKSKIINCDNQLQTHKLPIYQIRTTRKTQQDHKIHIQKTR